MGAIPVGDSDFSLSHAGVMLISSLFTFHYRAYNSPSLFTYHNMTHIFSGMQQFLSKNAYIRILHRLKSIHTTETKQKLRPTSNVVDQVW